MTIERFDCLKSLKKSFAPSPFSGERAACLTKYESFFSWSEEANDWVSGACIWKTDAQIAANGWSNVGNGMRGVIG